MTVADSEVWSIGSVEAPVRLADPAESRMLRAAFFYTGLASLLSWQVLLSLGVGRWGQVGGQVGGQVVKASKL